jgi:hypothetical protein
VPHLRLRVLPILLAALWQTNGEHFGVPQISAASSLRPASIQKSGSDGILARDNCEVWLQVAKLDHILLDARPPLRGTRGCAGRL